MAQKSYLESKKINMTKRFCLLHREKVTDGAPQKKSFWFIFAMYMLSKLNLKLQFYCRIEPFLPQFLATPNNVRCENELLHIF